jgi:hypothetical protein
MKKILLVTAAAILVIAMAGTSLAGTLPGIVKINATVSALCANYTEGDMSLTIDPSTSSPVYSSAASGFGNTTVQCSYNDSVTVSAKSAGSNTTSTTGVLSGALTGTSLPNIPYTLYFNNAFTGAGFGSATSTILITSTGSASTGVGVTTAAANAAQAGSYSDTVSLTITY